MKKMILVLTLPALWQLFLLYLAGSVVNDLTHLPQVDGLRTVRPAVTALMQARQMEAVRKNRRLKIAHSFVPYGQISPYLKQAVLVAEDGSFFSHQGIDYDEMREAIRTDWKKKAFARGASTITMQLAKNLYLSNNKSLTRKISEFILARRMDDVLTKQRILELYLNYIEWGDGIFGCQAAARNYFKCSAGELSPEQAIRMASIIINPRKYGPFTDTKRMVTRRSWIAGKMLQYDYLTGAEYDSLKF
jgi:monofunctional glycosyltransferase